MEGPNGWSIAQADAAYIGALRGAIVGVEITVNAITGKEKFSQNRCAEDREQVAAALAASARPSDWELARAMRAAADGRPDG
jgi:transcriptional regulator